MQLDFLINLMYITHFGQNWTYVVYRRPSSTIQILISGTIGGTLLGSRVFLRGLFLHVLECLYRGAPGVLCVVQGAGYRSAVSQECVTRVRDQSAPKADIKRPKLMFF